MTKVIRWFGDDTRRIVGGVLTAIIIMVVTYGFSTFGNIAIGSRHGIEAHKYNQEQDKRLDVLEESCINQRQVNYQVMKDMEYFTRAFERMEKQLDRIDKKIDDINDRK
jgi:chromosome segregation ATPase